MNIYQLNLSLLILALYLSINSNIVMKGGHHVGEVFKSISVEDGVHHLQDLPHVLTDMGRRQVTRQRHRLC